MNIPPLTFPSCCIFGRFLVFWLLGLMDILVLVFGWIKPSFLLGKYPGVDLLGVHMFTFSRFCQMVFQNGCIKCPRAKSESSSCPLATFGIVGPFHYNCPSERAMVSSCGFHVYFLMTSDDKHFSMCLPCHLCFLL